jgi:hypothetical protein
MSRFSDSAHEAYLLFSSLAYKTGGSVKQIFRFKESKEVLSYS